MNTAGEKMSNGKVRRNKAESSERKNRRCTNRLFGTSSLKEGAV
jgi:hypothetical protein